MKKFKDLDSALHYHRELVEAWRVEKHRRDSWQPIDPISADDFDPAPPPPKPYIHMTEDEFTEWYIIATKFPEDWHKMDVGAARKLYDAFKQEWESRCADDRRIARQPQH